MGSLTHLYQYALQNPYDLTWTGLGFLAQAIFGEGPGAMLEFDHVGITTTVVQPDENWVEQSRVWVTNPRAHPQRIEYIRPKNPPEVPPEQVGLWKLWHWPHVAYRVEELIDVPGRGEGAGFRFAVADDGGHNQFGIIERGATCVR